MTVTEKALEKFSEMMIEKLEGIQQDWKKPWFTEGCFAPENLSGRNYNGMNSIMLMIHCEKNGYKNPVFCTFDRAQSLNYKKDKGGKFVRLTGEDGKYLPLVSVNKGEKSFPVFITTYSVVNTETKEKIPYDTWRELSEEERKKYNVFPRLQVYNVFNIDQTNMSETRPELYEKITSKFKPVERPADEEFVFEPVDTMIAENKWECPIKPTYGDDAYYFISKDEIVVPEKKQFRDGEAFYSTLFHEMAHSTGAENRTNRLKPSSFGSAEYAREELVAELTAAFVAICYGMVKGIKADSAPYISAWLERLKEDKTYIKTVLMDVKKAASIITSRIDDMRMAE